MSTIKVDTIATRTGSGNITASNTIAGTSATLSGTLGVTGATTTANITTGNTSIITAGRFISSQTSNDPWFKGVNSSNNETLFIKKDGQIYSAFGLSVGGTGAANTLDDYEEGTWTPTVNNATGYSAQFGRYVKVGKLVFINANLNTSSTSSPGGTISGLPFTSSNTGNSAGNLSIGYYATINEHVIWIGGYVLNASNNIYIVGNANGHTGTTIQKNGFNAFSGNSRIMFSGVYETDA